MRISVKVKPRSSLEKIEKISNGEFLIWTHETPEKGKVNEKIRALLSAYFKIPKKGIILKTGAKNRRKIFEIITK